MSSAALFENNIHPRLLFGPEDVAGLRAKTRTGMARLALEEMLSRARRYTDPQHPGHIDPAGGRKAMLAGTQGEGGKVYDALHCLAFAYVLTGEEDWAAKAEPILRGLCELQPGEDLWQVDERLSLAFDLLHPALSEAARQTAVRLIRHWGVQTYQNRHLGRHIWGLGTNMFLHGFEKYVFALAAVYDPKQDRTALLEAEGFCRRAVHKGVDEGGAIFEGPSYGQGDASWLSTSAEILRRAGICDLWQSELRFANIPRHWIHLMLPGKRGQNTPCDAWRKQIYLPNWALLLGARRLNDPAIQWAWEQMGYHDPIAGQSPSPQRIESNLGYFVLWDDQQVAAKSPGEAGYPLSRCSGGMGLITMRSGWSDDDVYFSLSASGRTPGSRIHQHLDAGHFCLFALNEAFSIDSGYGDIGSEYHSILRPGAQASALQPVSFDQVHWGGRVESFGSSPCVDYGCVDASRQWNSRWQYRHAMLIKAPGVEPYAIILDDCNHNDTLSCYEWLLNSEPGNRIEVDEEQERACIHGQRHRLDLMWAYPGDQGFPVRHQLEVQSDQMNSAVLAHRTGDVNYRLGIGDRSLPRGGGRWGAGLRPRVKAYLWGYTGQLLTALVPRRQKQEPIRIERLSASTHFGMNIHWGPFTDTIVASTGDRRLNLGGLTGEATLAVARRANDGRLAHWIAADAYALAIDGKNVLPQQRAPIALRDGIGTM